MHKLFSVDDHVLEPPDTWTSRVSQKYKDVAPHLVRRDGEEFWVYEDVVDPTLGVLAVAGRPQKDWGIDQVSFAEMIPGCYDPKARAADMYSNGIFASICFPTLPGFGGRKLAQLKDKDLALECVRAWNDFILDEWCPAAPDLLVPMTITPLWDVDLVVEEVNRCLAKGTKALSFIEDPAKMGLPGYFTNYWDPLMSLVQEADIPLCMHLGSGGSGSIDEGSGHPVVQFAVSTFTMGAVCMTNLMCSPTARKFPDVKYVWSESGVGWVASALERADGQWARHRMWNDLPDFKPSDIAKQSFYFSIIDEPIGFKSVYEWDPEIEHVLWETDYPHAETPWPHTQKHVDEMFAEVTPEHLDRVTHSNAERVFNWTLKVPTPDQLPAGVTPPA
jgi:predicted TIM-barrel fold metal-dependent hydrolase